MNMIVVKDYNMAITTHMNIQFNSINGQCEGITKCGKCIFGSEVCTAPVCNSLDMLIHLEAIQLLLLKLFLVYGNFYFTMGKVANAPLLIFFVVYFMLKLTSLFQRREFAI